MKKLATILLSLVMALTLCVPAAATSNNGVRRIKMSKSSLELEIGASRTLFVKFTPTGTSDNINWRSNNSEVATVDDSGTVTGIGKGSTNIIAETDGGIKTTCRVTVSKVGADTLVRKVEMAVPTATVRVNQTRVLWVLFSPNDATDQDVIWSSSNNEVATVDDEGIVTGVAPGKAIITAEAYNGRSATCAVTVPGRVVSGITEDVVNLELPGSGEVLSAPEVKTVVENTARTTTKGQTGTASFENKTTISAAAVRAAAYTAKNNNREVLLKFTTKNDAGKNEGWLIIDPTKMGDTDANLRLGVTANSAKAQAVQANFEKYFSNKIAVIQLGQAGSFGMEVQVAAKVDLAGMDQDNLHFYTYDSATKRYSKLDIGSYTNNSSGFLQFSTSTGGVFIISDGKLESK